LLQLQLFKGRHKLQRTNSISQFKQVINPSKLIPIDGFELLNLVNQKDHIIEKEFEEEESNDLSESDERSVPRIFA